MPRASSMKWTEILKDAVSNLLPPAQFLFTYLAAIPKKDPKDKRGIGVLPTPIRILGRLLRPIYADYDRNNTDLGDTAIASGNLVRSTYERHALAEAIALTHGYSMAILWDLKSFFDSVKTYIALWRMTERDWDPAIILIAMWSHRAPQIVIYAKAASPICHIVAHSIVAGCTSSTSIARAVLPSLKELHLTHLPTHLKAATALYRHVDDIFQITWAPNLVTLLQQTANDALRLGEALLGLQLTISDKTKAVSRHPKAAASIARGLRNAGMQVKASPNGLDCGVLFTGGATPNKTHQQERIGTARRRATRTAKACKFDQRATALATGGVQPTQAYGAAALGTPFAVAKQMRTNMAAVLYGGTAQACPMSLIRLKIGAKHDPVVRIAAEAIENWTHLLRQSSDTRTLLRKAWIAIHWTTHARPLAAHTNGPTSGTIHWIVQA